MKKFKKRAKNDRASSLSSSRFSIILFGCLWSAREEKRCVDIDVNSMVGCTIGKTIMNQYYKTQLIMSVILLISLMVWIWTSI